MNKDTVALKGFGKMFKKFWNDQLNNINKLRSYIVNRGGYARTPAINVNILFLFY